MLSRGVDDAIEAPKRALRIDSYLDLAEPAQKLIYILHRDLSPALGVQQNMDNLNRPDEWRCGFIARKNASQDVIGSVGTLSRQNPTKSDRRVQYKTHQ